MGSPLGKIRLAATALLTTPSTEQHGFALSGLHFVGQKYYPDAANTSSVVATQEPLAFLRDVEQILSAYFLSGKEMPRIALAPRGTAFQQAVWQGLLTVKSGSTITYGQLAERIGNAAAVRAAAAAVGRNPISLIIPCHRIIGADGSLTGYAGGLDRKAQLLALEST